eukprot:GHVU01121482.1.p1 GENE.GHVU01121482.1~~GHVU01121482.1.p1  ORF type:complete len:251 (+),score=45.39 GHVU01121482.1:867-1619(+)
MMFLNWQATSFVNGFWKVVGQMDVKMTEKGLVTAGAAAAVINSVSRLLWGWAGDKHGNRATMITFSFLYCVILAATPACFLIVPAAPTLAKAVYVVLLFALRVMDGGAFTLIAPITCDAFGAADFSAVFGLLFTARATSSLVSAQMAQLLFPRVGSGGMFVFTGACMFASGMAVRAVVPGRSYVTADCCREAAASADTRVALPTDKLKAVEEEVEEELVEEEEDNTPSTCASGERVGLLGRSGRLDERTN